MTDRQKYALDHPVENPVPDANTVEQYRRLEKLGRLNIQTVLTVERTGTNEYQWHASLSMINSGRPETIIGNVTVDEGDDVIMHLKGLLDGVGQGNPAMLPPGPVLHMFKKMTAQEQVRANKYSILKN